MNKETSQTNIRFGYKELHSFKKVYGDFESIRKKKKDLELKLKVQQTESDHCTLSDIRLIKKTFVEKLSYCVVSVPYILLLELLNECLPSNCAHVLLQSRCKICSL